MRYPTIDKAMLSPGERRGEESFVASSEMPQDASLSVTYVAFRC